MKRMKKLLIVLLTLALVFAFGACTADTPEDTDGAALTAETIKVGHIHINDEAEQGYSTAHINGVNTMAETLGIPAENVIGKYNIKEDSSCDTALRELVEAGCNIIFLDSFGHEDYMLEVAAEYPDVAFCHATGFQASGSGLDNVSNFFGSVFEARYLAGIVAGMITESDQLGYVTAQEFPECVSGLSAFYIGATSVNPDVTMDIIYTNTWYDVTAETQAAQALIDSGADVLGQHADSTATQGTAETNGVYGIGYNTDMSAAAPNANVASVVWDWSPAYTHFVEALLNGEALGTDWSGDLASGMVDVVYNDALLDTFANAAEIKAAVADAKEAIIAGELEVFAGPLVDADGVEVVAEGDFFDESGEVSAPSWFNILQGVNVID
jgi:basic membrane protein A and related proteins